MLMDSEVMLLLFCHSDLDVSMLKDWTINRHSCDAKVTLRARPKQMLAYNNRKIPVHGRISAKATVGISQETLFYV